MLLTILSITLLSAAPAPSIDQTLARVQSTYDNAGDIKASFTQTYVEKLRGKQRSEKGVFWAKEDGRVRWQYQKPTVKEFIFDGQKAYFYEPENAQVTIFDDFQQTDLSNALRFLIGQGNLKERFDVGPCRALCDLVKGNTIVLEMLPKKPMASVDKILMFIDPTSFRVSTSAVFDSLGNRTEYAFSGVQFHAKVSPRNFVFKTPKGVQQLRATQDGLAPAAKKP